MKKNQLILNLVLAIFVLAAIGAYYFYFGMVNKPTVKAPVACREGDIYNMNTGQKCPFAELIGTSTIKTGK